MNEHVKTNLRLQQEIARLTHALCEHQLQDIIRKETALTIDEIKQEIEKLSDEQKAELRKLLGEGNAQPQSGGTPIKDPPPIGGH